MPVRDPTVQEADFAAAAEILDTLGSDASAAQRSDVLAAKTFVSNSETTFGINGLPKWITQSMLKNTRTHKLRFSPSKKLPKWALLDQYTATITKGLADAVTPKDAKDTKEKAPKTPDTNGSSNNGSKQEFNQYQHKYGKRRWWNSSQQTPKPPTQKPQTNKPAPSTPSTPTLPSSDQLQNILSQQFTEEQLTQMQTALQQQLGSAQL